MFWYKSWLDTRWRFLIALVVLTCSAVLTVFAYPKVVALLPAAANVGSGALGRRIREIAELERSYRGYVWVQAFRQTLTQLGVLFAVLLGTGGLLPSGSKDTALFTMSLPASRNELLGARVATGLAQLAVLAWAPALVFPLLSPAIGQTFTVGSALVHGACLFVAWAVFFSLALLLSTSVRGAWGPALIALCAAFVLAAVDQAAGGVAAYSIFAVMSGENYFRTGALPWAGLLLSAAASAAMLYAGSRRFARHDF
ncbi:MAG TPA: hypothetical protein VN654_19020 [Vicinamibacterales bacterium]|jgi:hypothetical protein|nr:hypothetical protein [Vicinamibacterales bacterium]